MYLRYLYHQVNTKGGQNGVKDVFIEAMQLLCSKSIVAPNADNMLRDVYVDNARGLHRVSWFSASTPAPCFR